MKKIFLLLLIICEVLYSQNTEKINSSLSIKFETGLMFPGVSRYVFSADNYYSRIPFNKKTNTVLPNFNFGVGIGTNHLIKLYNTFIGFSLEGNYGFSSTGKVKTVFYDGDAEYTRSTIPIMVWTTLKTDGIINPFIKIGVGIENTQIEEEYYNASELNVKLSDWGFCWGIGGGIDIKLNNNLSLALLVDSFIRENGIDKILDDGRKIYMDFRIGSYSASFELTYEL